MGFPNIWNLIPRPNLTHLVTNICVHMCVCRCACVLTHMRGRIYIYTHAHMYRCTHTRLYTCMCIYPTHSVTYILCNWINWYHFKSLTSCMSSLRFCLLCSKLESVGHCLRLSNKRTQFTPQEIWKRHAVLLSIHTEDSIWRFLDAWCQAKDSAEYSIRVWLTKIPASQSRP